MKFNYTRLRQSIYRNGLTQHKLAELLGISATSLSLKLNNRIEFSNKDIINIVNILNINPNEIHLYFFDVNVNVHQHELYD